MSGKKPGNDTERVVPPGASATTPRRAAAPQKDAFQGGPAERRAAAGGVPPGRLAPEVSQGAWRERVFMPRAVMSKVEVVTALEATLRVALSTANHVRVAFEALRLGWLPAVRQALEQAGGDGLDAWLSSLLKPPGRVGLDPLLPSLVADYARLRDAKDLAAFERQALQVIESVRRAMAFERPRKLSFKVLERELEGKLEVDELFLIAVSDEGELTRRVKELSDSTESLREQLRKRPGRQPDGLYANFVRLKAELRVREAELRRRGSSGTA
ncbi:MAG: hypothetical protein INH41_09970 [Myxococcaceae bacterium]|jgi:hypothetical protein|nr:hypothetical protein [Myxococcaceae bacterium]